MEDSEAKVTVLRPCQLSKGKKATLLGVAESSEGCGNKDSPSILQQQAKSNRHPAGARDRQISEPGRRSRRFEPVDGVQISSSSPRCGV